MKQLPLPALGLRSEERLNAAVRSTFLSITTLLFLFWAVARPAQSQVVGGGQIQGTVADSTGAAVPGATVEVDQTESGLKRVAVSGGDGGYLFPNLPVGPYVLKVSKPGFEAYQQTGIVIEVGNNLRVDLSLKVGGATQTVQVEANASMVQTEDQAVSQVIDAQRVIDLPLNGRQADATHPAHRRCCDCAQRRQRRLARTIPAKSLLPVAGSQGTQTEYLMDGADNTDCFLKREPAFPVP